MAENKIVLYLVHSLDNVKQDSGLEYENTIDPFGIKFHDDNLGLRFVSTKSFIIARLVVWPAGYGFIPRPECQRRYTITEA